MTKGVSAYRDKLDFFKPTGDFVVGVGGTLTPEYKCFKSLWCQKEDIIRENLESLVSGATHVKKRTRLTLRYRNDITEDMYFMSDNLRYDIKIVGDKDGSRREIQVIGEAVTDGGV